MGLSMEFAFMGSFFADFVRDTFVVRILHKETFYEIM